MCFSYNFSLIFVTFYTLLNVVIFRPQMYRHVPYDYNYSYNFKPVFLKLWTGFLPSLQKCIWFGYDFYIYFVTFSTLTLSFSYIGGWGWQVRHQLHRSSIYFVFVNWTGNTPVSDPLWSLPSTVKRKGTRQPSICFITLKITKYTECIIIYAPN